MTTKPILATGIDAGSNYTRVMIGLVEDEKLRFLGCGCSPAAGWAKSFPTRSDILAPLPTQ